MTYTQSALWPYLYGHHLAWEMVGEELKIQAMKNPDHQPYSPPCRDDSLGLSCDRPRSGANIF